MAFAALVRRYERSVLRVRLVNGRWAPLRGVRTEPGAAETVSVIIDSPDAEPLSPVMAPSYGLIPREQQVVEGRRLAVHDTGVPAPPVRQSWRRQPRRELVAALFSDGGD